MKQKLENNAGNDVCFILRYWVYLFCLFAFCNTSFAQQSNIKFTHLSNLDGLSQSTVQAILKDRHGFMWFGTQDGLNRYDGYTFKVYRHKPRDTSSLRRSHILSLYEDHQGNLWVGTYNGALSMYDRNRDAFVHYKEISKDRDGLSQKSVTAIYEDKQNNFWVGTYWRLNLLDRKTGKVTQFGTDPADPESISNDGISCIFEDSKNNLWIGTSSGLNILDRKTKKFKRFLSTNDPGSISDNAIAAIYEDRQGRLWVGTGNGLNLFDRATGKFKRFQQQPDNPRSLGSNQITAIDDAGNGKLWVGTKTYLELFDVDKNVFTHFQSSASNPTTLSKNGNVTAMYHDRHGILWVGTYQGGINKYDEQLTYFDAFRSNPIDLFSLSFNVVTSFAESLDGNVWVGTDGGGLNYWNRSNNTFVHHNPDPNSKDSLASWSVLSLCQSKKTRYLWIGTYGHCVDRYDPETHTFKHFKKGDAPDQLNNDAVYRILEDSRGNIWMGTNGGGANVLNPTTGIITRYVNNPDNENSIAGNFVRAFFEDEKGNIWIGTTAGMSVYDPQKKSFTTYNQSNTGLESDVIFSIYKDSKGNMWIGTVGGGLTRLDPQTKKLKIYTSYEGLPDNTVNSIVEDKLGYLWLSTNNGISRFDPRKQIFRNSGLNNGLQSFEFLQGAGLRTSNGEILFGGVNGFNAIDPTNLIENTNVPPVVITGFKIFNRPVIAGGNESPLIQDIQSTKEIRLSYDQSIFSFDFSALGFTSPERNQYAYMMEGFDNDWNHVGTNRSATYTNLNPGEYTFKVKASNNDGIWNEQGSSIRIIITPPYWQTWWFKLSATLALIGGVILLYKSRMRAMEKQKILLEQQVFERTQSLASKTLEEQKARQDAYDANRELERKNKELEQFAYVASHDLQEPLRTTSSFVELLQQQYKGKLDAKADKYLTYIVDASGRMKVLISDLLEYSRIGSKKELKHVDCNAILSEVITDLDAAINETGAKISSEELPVVSGYSTEMKQLFQNLIINAIKFRKKDVVPQIKISSEKNNGHWKFAFQDNGIGIDPQYNERIFVIFQRLHTRSEYQGSGIGLSHCKKIVELHKGKIWVDSVPGAGSTFYFTVKENHGE